MYKNSSPAELGNNSNVVDVDKHINPTFDADENTYDCIGNDTRRNMPDAASRDRDTAMVKSLRTIKMMSVAGLVGLVVVCAVLVGTYIPTLTHSTDDIITKVGILEEELMTANKNLITHVEQLEVEISGLNQNNSELVALLHAANLPRSCADVSGSNPRQVTVLFSGMEVLCDTVTEGGGWLVFQRRTSNETDFYRGWEEYKSGFGKITGNFWMGLEQIHTLTSRRRYELRVDLTYNNRSYFASYDNFRVTSEADKFRLAVSGYSGDAGDSLGYHNNQPFSTKDQDNDAWSKHCAQERHGAWWYKACHKSNLNAEMGSKEGYHGLYWNTLTGLTDTATATEMKMRHVI